MELIEIFALIKKAIFLVGGGCILVLLYYRYVKPNQGFKSPPMKKGEEPKRDDTPVVRPRRCDVGTYEDDTMDISDIIQVDERERGWIDMEDNPVDEFLDKRTPLERRKQLQKELEELGYVSSWEENTDMDTDPQ